VQALNGLAQKSYVADRVIMIGSESHLLRSAPLIACLWWIWFSDAPPAEKLCNRIAAFAGLAGCMLAVVFTRTMQNFLPARPRPIHTEGLGVVMPFGITTETVANWSSFPSDTAALLLAVAAAIWLRSRALGAIAFAWAVLVGGLPRVFAGFHYPSDILAGGLLGVSLVFLLARLRVTKRAVQSIGVFEERHRGAFCALAFLVCYQTTNFFTDLRHYGHAIGRFLEKSPTGAVSGPGQRRPAP
jgi:undecaprenyl-diphosphatase